MGKNIMKHLNYLIQLADHLDKNGFNKEADVIDNFLKLSYWPPAPPMTEEEIERELAKEKEKPRETALAPFLKDLGRRIEQRELTDINQARKETAEYVLSQPEMSLPDKLSILSKVALQEDLWSLLKYLSGAVLTYMGLGLGRRPTREPGAEYRMLVNFQKLGISSGALRNLLGPEQYEEYKEFERDPEGYMKEYRKRKRSSSSAVRLKKQSFNRLISLAKRLDEKGLQKETSVVDNFIKFALRTESQVLFEEKAREEDIIKALDNPDKRVRLEVVRQLCEDYETEYLLLAFDDSDEEVRVAAIECVGAKGDANKLVKVLEDPSENVRREAVKWIGAKGDVSLLEKVLDDPSESIRSEAKKWMKRKFYRVPEPVEQST